MERLKELRISRGLSQAQLARKAGVTDLTVNDLELGKRKARPSTALKIAKALGVEVKDLTDWRAKNLEMGAQELRHIYEVAELLDAMLTGLEDLDEDEFRQRMEHIHRARKLLRSGLENAIANTEEMHRIEGGDALEAANADENGRATLV